MNEEILMRRCLQLAEGGRGKTGVNPLVGAVLVRDGQILAEGFHGTFGGAHAERSLLEKYEQKISSKDVLYVNLEPCCHRGKTSPCTDIILERRVKHVVVGMIDPNSLIAGQGIAALRSHGVTVTGPVLPEACLRLNRGFVSWQKRGRPWITLKKAQTRDGAISHSDGSTLKITSASQDEWAHTRLRARHDAIAVGVETVVRDDPLLSVRMEEQSLVQPYKLIVDPHLRIPGDAKVLDDRCILVTGENCDTSLFEKMSVRCWKLPLADEGHFEWNALWHTCLTPAGDFHGITSLLVEGGNRTWQLFRGAGFVDEEVILVG